MIAILKTLIVFWVKANLWVIQSKIGREALRVGAKGLKEDIKNFKLRILEHKRDE